MAVNCLPGAIRVEAQSPPASPSAIGQAIVSWLAIAPNYAQSGVVAAVASQFFCSKDCVKLWVTRDGGATWHQAKAHGWTHGRTSIAADGQGRVRMFSAASGSLVESLDYGENWLSVGAGGSPAIPPSYASDGKLVVASSGSGGNDYVLDAGGTTTSVKGSGGKESDLDFAVSSPLRDGGRFSPALLVGINRSTSFADVLRCNAALDCSNAVTLPSQGGGGAFATAGTYLLLPDDYAQTGTVFADRPGGLAKSTDGGASFLPLNVVPTAGATITTVPMMALAPHYGDAGAVRTVYASVWQLFQPTGGGPGQSRTSGGVFKSADGGLTWTQLAPNSPLSGGSQAVVVAPDGRMFAGYYDNAGKAGLLCSTDRGSTWTASCPAIHTSGNSSVGQGAGGTGAGSDKGRAGSGAGNASGGSAASNGRSDNGGGTDNANGGSASALVSAANASGSRSTWPIVVIAVVVAMLLATLFTWRRGWLFNRKPTSES